MELTTVTITSANLMEALKDPTVYVIHKSIWPGKEFEMVPIHEVRVEELLSSDVLVVRITKK